MTDSEWSLPESAVFAGASERLDADEPAVLATVVGVEGSAYRRPGAKMLVGPEGAGVGHITAGCLESEVEALARDVLDVGDPRVETYDLMEDDDDVWGMGVGCNGVVDILLEPLGPSLRPVVAAYEAGDDLVTLTVLDGDGVALGERFHYAPDGDPPAGAVHPPDWLSDVIAGPAQDLLDRGVADTVTVEVDGDDVTVFVDAVTAPPELVVLGSGHDVGPVVELAGRTDFRVTVVGFRGATDLDERFPAADRTITSAPARVGEAVDVDEDTYVVVMTHNFVDDRLALESLLSTPTGYVGLMGPHERFEEILEAFDEEGRTFSESELSRVYTPVGLDLGGSSPYQIATSIVGEVLAVHNDTSAGHLRDQQGSIHERVEVDPPEQD